MPKKFTTPFYTANAILTNMQTDLGMDIDDWDKRRQELQEALAIARQLEELEVFNLDDGVVVDVWTGMVRSITKKERLSILQGMLDAKETERKALKEQIRALEAQRPVAFNWKRYKKGKP